MSELQIPFGARKGELVSIDKVERGLACECLCPKCKRKLIARKGEVRQHYFAHYEETDCIGAFETSLHLMAKQIIKEEKKLTTPKYFERLQAENNNNETHYSEPIEIKAKEIIFDKVIIEKRLDDFQPDLIGKVGDKELLIEIKVTHEVDEEKRKKVRDKGIAMVEIDLSKISRDCWQNRNRFRKEVLNKLENRVWVFNPKLEKLRKKKKMELDKLIEVENRKIDKKNEALERKFKREQEIKLKRAEEIEMSRKKVRASFQKNIDFLYYMQTNEGKVAYDKIMKEKLEKDFAHYKGLIDFDLREIPKFINIYIEGDWYFNTDRIIWQTEIYKKFILNRDNERLVNLRTVYSWLKKKIELEKLTKRLVIETIKTKERYSNATKCWFLTFDEGKILPNSFDIVQKYLIRLIHLGVLEMHSFNNFQVIINSFDAFKEYEKRLLEEKRIRIERENKERGIRLEIEREEKQRLDKAKRFLEENKNWKEITNRLIISDKRVLTLEKDHLKLGIVHQKRRCKNCLLASTNRDGKFCPFCKKKSFTDFEKSYKYFTRKELIECKEIDDLIKRNVKLDLKELDYFLPEKIFR